MAGEDIVIKPRVENKILFGISVLFGWYGDRQSN
jgi:hypothetical protein